MERKVVSQSLAKNTCHWAKTNQPIKLHISILINQMILIEMNFLFCNRK